MFLKVVSHSRRLRSGQAASMVQTTYIIFVRYMDAQVPRLALILNISIEVVPGCLQGLIRKLSSHFVWLEAFPGYKQPIFLSVLRILNWVYATFPLNNPK